MELSPKQRFRLESMELETNEALVRVAQGLSELFPWKVFLVMLSVLVDADHNEEARLIMIFPHCILIAHFGDFNSSIHHPGYLADSQFIPDQNDDFLSKVESLHEQHRCGDGLGWWWCWGSGWVLTDAPSLYVCCPLASYGFLFVCFNLASLAFCEA